MFRIEGRRKIETISLVCVKSHIKTDCGVRYKIKKGQIYTFEKVYYPTSVGLELWTEAYGIYLCVNYDYRLNYKSEVVDERFISVKEYRKQKIKRLELL